MLRFFHFTKPVKLGIQDPVLYYTPSLSGSRVTIASSGPKKKMIIMFNIMEGQELASQM